MFSHWACLCKCVWVCVYIGEWELERETEKTPPSIFSTFFQWGKFWNVELINASTPRVVVSSAKCDAQTLKEGKKEEQTNETKRNSKSCLGCFFISVTFKNSGKVWLRIYKKKNLYRRSFWAFDRNASEPCQKFVWLDWQVFFESFFCSRYQERKRSRKSAFGFIIEEINFAFKNSWVRGRGGALRER